VAKWQVGGEPALLGPDRAQELVTNAVLPFLALDASLREQALAFLGAVPAGASYGKTRFLEHNLKRTDGNKRVRGVTAQQGLLGLLNDWCSRAVAGAVRSRRNCVTTVACVDPSPDSGEVCRQSG
jgi:hypothetical protein